MRGVAYDGLIFDLDGTLWDTTKPVTRAWNAVAEKRSDLPSVSDSEIRSVMGLSHEEAFDKLLPGVRPEAVESAAKEFYEEEVVRLRDNYLYPGVPEGLHKLSQNYALFVVSNCQPSYLTRFYELTGMKALFKDAECYGATLKPKGDNISLVMRRNRLSKAAYVGDTAGDQIAARQAGADFYHAAYGFGSPAQESLGFESFTQISEFFLSLLV